MPSLLSFLSGASKIAGAGYAGYGQDKQQELTETLARLKAARDAENDRIANALKVREINTPRLGDAGYADAVAGVEGAKAKATLQPDIDKAKGIAEATAPVTLSTHRAERLFDNANQPDSFTTTTIGGDPNVPGSGKVVSVNTRTGVKGSDIGDAKPSISNAKLTDPQEKSYLFYNLMKNAEPEITGALATGRIRPSAVSAYLAAGNAAEIPLVGKAIGAVAKPVANANLNEDEQKLIRAGKDFTAGVLRKESGAAVTASELMETMERYFPGMFGDKPGLTDAKTLARQQYMKTMEDEAGPAIRFYQHQTGAGRPATGRVPTFEEWLEKQNGGGPPDA